MSDRVRVSVRRPYFAPRSPWHLDVAAGTLLLAGLLVALCVFSYDPADAPGTSVAPVNDRPANLLGSPGAHVAHALVGSLGLAAYVLLACWFFTRIYGYAVHTGLIARYSAESVS